jgi:hypothetical protein
MPARDRAPQPERVLLKQGLGASPRQDEGVRALGCERVGDEHER